MSTPQDSTAPVPVDTTDPAASGGKTSVVRYSEEVEAWIAAMSPSGASVYDTGWAALTPASGFTATVGMEVRRIGVEVMFRGRVNRTAGAWTGSLTVCTVPVGLRPASFAYSGAVTTNANVTAAYIFVNTDGTMNIVPFASGNNFLINPVRYTVD